MMGSDRQTEDTRALPMARNPDPDQMFHSQSVLRLDWGTIAAVVDNFYDQVTRHPTLKVPFSSVADWPHHKDRLTYFWWVVLGGDKFRKETYEPVPKHFKAGFSEELLGDWLLLFEATVKNFVPEPFASAWVSRAQQVGAGLLLANQSYGARMAPDVTIGHPVVRSTKDEASG